MYSCLSNTTLHALFQYVHHLINICLWNLDSYRHQSKNQNNDDLVYWDISGWQTFHLLNITRMAPKIDIHSIFIYDKNKLNNHRSVEPQRTAQCPLQAPQIIKFMGPTWGPPGSCRPQIGPMLAPWTLLSGTAFHQLLALIAGICQALRPKSLSCLRWPTPDCPYCGHHN